MNGAGPRVQLWRCVEVRATFHVRAFRGDPSVSRRSRDGATRKHKRAVHPEEKILGMHEKNARFVGWRPLPDSQRTRASRETFERNRRTTRFYRGIEDPTGSHPLGRASRHHEGGRLGACVNPGRTGRTRPSGCGDDAASDPRRHRQRASTSMGTCAHVVTGRARETRGGAGGIVAAVGRSIFAMRAGICPAPAAGGGVASPTPLRMLSNLARILMTTRGAGLCLSGLRGTFVRR